VHTVLTAPGTAWCWSPKVLRAGMGAHFHLSIHEAVPWSAVRTRLGVAAIGTRAQQAESLFEADKETEGGRRKTRRRRTTRKTRRSKASGRA
jgi:tRNA G18 (ribose-2'-O)-methylase SpoU